MCGQKHNEENQGRKRNTGDLSDRKKGEGKKLQKVKEERIH